LHWSAARRRLRTFADLDLRVVNMLHNLVHVAHVEPLPAARAFHVMFGLVPGDAIGVSTGFHHRSRASLRRLQCFSFEGNDSGIFGSPPSRSGSPARSFIRRRHDQLSFPEPSRTSSSPTLRGEAGHLPFVWASLCHEKTDRDRHAIQKPYLREPGQRRLRAAR
jgi:hypothetical protein